MNPILFLRKTLFLTPFSFPAILWAQSGPSALTANDQPWTRQEDIIYGDIRRADLNKMKTEAYSLQGWMEESFPATGIAPTCWWSEFVSGNLDGLQFNRFRLDCAFFLQPRDGRGTYSTQDGPDAQIEIVANDLSPLAVPMTVNGKTFLTIPYSHRDRKGFPYFEYELAADTSSEMVQGIQAWVVSYSGELPYLPVSRLEYLKEASQEVQAQKDEMIRQLKQYIPVRSEEEQTSFHESQAKLIQDSYSGTVREARLKVLELTNQKDEEYLKARIKAKTTGYDETLALIDSLTKFSRPMDLQKPAMLSTPAADFQGFEDGRPGERMLIRWNKRYFNKKSPAEGTRFFTVIIHYDRDLLHTENLDGELGNQLHLDYLQNLLAK